MFNARFRLAPTLLTTGLLAMCALSARAEEEPLATDRPDFVESSDVVGAGRFQIETSVAFERSKVDGTREKLRATPTLLRIGIGDTLEARIETDGALYLRSTDETGLTTRDRGRADIALGLKWHTHDGDEAKVAPASAGCCTWTPTAARGHSAARAGALPCAWSPNGTCQAVTRWA